MLTLRFVTFHEVEPLSQNPEIVPSIALATKFQPPPFANYKTTQKIPKALLSHQADLDFESVVA